MRSARRKKLCGFIRILRPRPSVNLCGNKLFLSPPPPLSLLVYLFLYTHFPSPYSFLLPFHRSPSPSISITFLPLPSSLSHFLLTPLPLQLYPSYIFLFSSFLHTLVPYFLSLSFHLFLRLDFPFHFPYLLFLLFL